MCRILIKTEGNKYRKSYYVSNKGILARTVQEAFKHKLYSQIVSYLHKKEDIIILSNIAKFLEFEPKYDCKIKDRIY